MAKWYMSVAASARRIHSSTSVVIIHVQTCGSAAASRSPGACRPSSGSSVTIRPWSVGRRSTPLDYVRADLRVRLHEVRVAFRGARPQRRDAELPGLLERECPEAVLDVRDPRRAVGAELRPDGGRRRRLLRRRLRLRPLASYPLDH